MTDELYNVFLFRFIFSILYTRVVYYLFIFYSNRSPIRSHTYILTGPFDLGFETYNMAENGNCPMIPHWFMGLATQVPIKGLLVL